jgi:hypothetical protein
MRGAIGSFKGLSKKVCTGVDKLEWIRYLNKAVEASSAKELLRATSEPRKIYIVLRDRIAFKIRECNRRVVRILSNRDDESD